MRQVERRPADMDARRARGEPKRHGTSGPGAAGASDVGAFTGGAVLVGWAPGCACDAGEPVPAIVLDPFSGSGTTGETAVRLRRRAILVDLNHAYLREHAAERTSGVQVELGLGAAV